MTKTTKVGVSATPALSAAQPAAQPAAPPVARPARLQALPPSPPVSHHQVGVGDKVDGSVGRASAAVAIELDAVSVVRLVDRKHSAVQEAVVRQRQPVNVRVRRPNDTGWRGAISSSRDQYRRGALSGRRARDVAPGIGIDVPVTRSPTTRAPGRSRGNVTSGLGSPVDGSCPDSAVSVAHARTDECHARAASARAAQIMHAPGLPTAACCGSWHAAARAARALAAGSGPRSAVAVARRCAGRPTAAG